MNKGEKRAYGERVWASKQPLPGNSRCKWGIYWQKGSTLCPRISRDDHVTRSLLYAWLRWYQERGEAALVPGRATAVPPEIERPENAEEYVASLERLCGKPALELDRVRSEVDVLQKACHQLPSVP